MRNFNNLTFPPLLSPAKNRVAPAYNFHLRYHQHYQHLSHAPEFLCYCIHWERSSRAWQVTTSIELLTDRERSVPETECMRLLGSPKWAGVNLPLPEEKSPQSMYPACPSGWSRNLMPHKGSRVEDKFRRSTNMNVKKTVDFNMEKWEASIMDQGIDEGWRMLKDD